MFNYFVDERLKQIERFVYEMFLYKSLIHTAHFNFSQLIHT